MLTNVKNLFFAFSSSYVWGMDKMPHIENVVIAGYREPKQLVTKCKTRNGNNTRNRFARIADNMHLAHAIKMDRANEQKNARRAKR